MKVSVHNFIITQARLVYDNTVGWSVHVLSQPLRTLFAVIHLNNAKKKQSMGDIQTHFIACS